VDAVQQELVSYKLDSSGVYNRKDSISIPAESLSYSKDYSLSSSSGWILLSVDGLSPTHQIFKIDAEGIFSNKTYPLTGFRYCFMFATASVVAFREDQISTYTFVESSWMILRTEKPTSYTNYGTWQRIQPNYVYRFVRVGETEDYSAEIWTRLENGWGLAETIPLIGRELSNYFNVLYDGNDTVVMSFGSYGFGEFFVRRKVNNEWLLTQNLTEADVGFVSNNTDFGSFLGRSIQLVDHNTIVATAPYEGFTNDFSTVGGSIVWLERDKAGVWRATKRAQSKNQVTYGIGLVVLDTDVITFESVSNISLVNGEYAFNQSLYLTRASPCSVEPNDVTCQSLEASSCDSLPSTGEQLNVTSLFTINGPVNCGPISAHQTAFRKESETVEIDFTFSRSGVNNVTCTSVISCTMSPPQTNSPRSTTSAGLTFVVNLSLLASFVLALL
jgi:hypothetical protein